MRRFLLFIAAVILTASIALGGECDGLSFTDFQALGATGCTIGPLLLYDFAYSTYTTNGGTVLPGDQMVLQTFSGPYQVQGPGWPLLPAVGFNVTVDAEAYGFTGDAQAGVNISYDVRAPGGITGAGMGIDALAGWFGTASGSEGVTPTPTIGPPSCTWSRSFDVGPGAGGIPQAGCLYDSPVYALTVGAGVYADGYMGDVGFVRSFGNQFAIPETDPETETPEPSSWLLLASALLVAISLLRGWTGRPAEKTLSGTGVK